MPERGCSRIQKVCLIVRKSALPDPPDPPDTTCSRGTEMVCPLVGTVGVGPFSERTEMVCPLVGTIGVGTIPRKGLADSVAAYEPRRSVSLSGSQLPRSDTNPGAFVPIRAVRGPTHTTDEPVNHVGQKWSVHLSVPSSSTAGVCVPGRLAGRSPNLRPDSPPVRACARPGSGRDP